MSFWDFGGVLSLVTGGPDYGNDFGIDQTTQTAINQMAKGVTDILASFQTERSDLWGTVRNNVLSNIGKSRNSMIMSLANNTQNLQSTLKNIEVQQTQEQEEALSAAITTLAGALAGKGTFLATVQSELEQITYTGGLYVGDLMGKTQYIEMIAGKMLDNYLDSGGKLSDLFSSVNPTLQQYGDWKSGYQMGGDEILSGFRTVLTDLGRGIQEAAETEAGKVFGEVGIAQATMGTMTGLGILIGSMLSIPGDSLQPTQEQIDAAMAEFQAQQERDMQDAYDQMEYETGLEFVDGEWKDTTKAKEVAQAITNTILGTGANLQATLGTLINNWLQTVSTGYGGDSPSDDSGNLGLVSNLLGFGGFF